VKRHNDVEKIRNKPQERWTVQDIGTMNAYKRGNDKVPTGRDKEVLMQFFEAHKTNRL
jgi:hypothetical protein